MMGLGRDKIKIKEIKTELYKNKKVKMIYLEKTTNRCRCPECNKYTKSVHGMLKASYIRELDFQDMNVYLK